MDHLKPTDEKNVSESSLVNASTEREQIVKDEDQVPKQPKSEKLTLTVKQVKSFKEENSEYIGSQWTQIAFKSPKSYLVATFYKGFLLIENNITIDSGMLPDEVRLLQDIIYVPCLNSYLIASPNQLYRKDINDRPPYFYMNLDEGRREFAPLRYSNLNQSLIINKMGNYISVINPKTRKVEIQMDVNQEKVDGIRIMDFRIFGEKENRLISVMNNGLLSVYSLDFGRKRGVVAEYQVELIRQRSEFVSTLAVCHKGGSDQVAVNIGCYPTQTSRIVLFQLTESNLVKLASVDHGGESIPEILALEPFERVKGNIHWVGLTRKFDGKALIYDYDLKSGSFEELKDNRLNHLEYEPFHLHRQGDEFYYTGSLGHLMSLTVTLG